MDNTLESFINFCDEMQIAEESYREIKKYNKIFKKKMDLLKIKIKQGCDDYDEQAKLIDEMVDIIDDYIKVVKDIKITTGDSVVGKIKEILGVVTVLISTIAAFTIVGLPIAVPGFCLAGSLAKDSDPYRSKKDMLSDLDKAKTYLLNVKKCLKNDNIANESVGSVKEEKRKLKNDLHDSGYGLGSNGRFKRDVRSANRYIDYKVKSSIIKKYKSDIDLIKKIADEFDKEFVYISHKYKKSLKSIDVNKISDDDGLEYQIYIENTYVGDDPYDRAHRKDLINFTKELTEASDEIKRKYKSSLGSHIKIAIDEINDVDYILMVEVKLVDYED